jgi:predicted nucleic acid-binding protein
VLVYAANVDSPEHSRCSELVEGWRSGRRPWYTAWAILYEFLRVDTHPRVTAEPVGRGGGARIHRSGAGFADAWSPGCIGSEMRRSRAS